MEADKLFCDEIADCFCGAELSENNGSETDALLAATSDEYDHWLTRDRDYSQCMYTYMCTVHIVAYGHVSYKCTQRITCEMK